MQQSTLNNPFQNLLDAPRQSTYRYPVVPRHANRNAESFAVLCTERTELLNRLLVGLRTARWGRL